MGSVSNLIQEVFPLTSFFLTGPFCIFWTLAQIEQVLSWELGSRWLNRDWEGDIHGKGMLFLIKMNNTATVV